MAAARRHRGMTQADLADRTGVSRMAVSKIETGERRIALAEAVAIAEALEVPLLDMLGSGPLILTTQTRVA